ncbi:MAG: RDD family protein [Acidimicrobiales bacterium]
MPPSEPGEAARPGPASHPEPASAGGPAPTGSGAPPGGPVRPAPFPPRLPEPQAPPGPPMAGGVQAHGAPPAPGAERVGPRPGPPTGPPPVGPAHPGHAPTPAPGPHGRPPGPPSPPGPLGPSGPSTLDGREAPPSGPAGAHPPAPRGADAGASEPGAPATEPEDPPTPPTLEDFPATGPNALADIWQRALGLAIDSLLCLFPVMLVYIGVTGAETLANQPVDSVETPVWVLAAFVVSLAIYQIVALSWTGQTFAMWVVGIRCARYLDGEKPTPSQAAIRSLFPAAAAAAPFPFSMTQYVIYLSAMFDPLRRAWHDQAGGTIIVRTR